MPLPNLIHAGFAKCGSTFLQSFLRQHPQISFRFKTNFFGPFSGCSFEQGPVHYAEMFRQNSSTTCVVESDEHLLMPLAHPKLGCRAMTLESCETILKRIKSTVPKARILLIVREQVDMMSSTYSQYLLGGGTFGADDFAREFVSSADDGINYFSFFFDQIWELLQDYFPERCKVKTLTELGRNSQLNLDEICLFAGVTPRQFNGGFFSRRAGLSYSGLQGLLRFNRMVTRYPTGRYGEELRIPRLTFEFGCKCLRLVDYYGLQILARKTKKFVISPAVREELRAMFAESNRRFSKFAKINLFAESSTNT